MQVILDDDRAAILHGECSELSQVLAEDSVDSLVTDPPAGIDFMAKGWDSDKGGRDKWEEWLTAQIAPSFRALKPGAYGLIWALPRTSHWTATAAEDAGFEIRDVHHHIFGCVPPETEMLTERGWVRYDQLRVGEQVVQIDDRGRAALGALENVSVYPFDGEMRRISTRSTEQLLTPGHSVHAYAKRGKWKRIEIDNSMTKIEADALCDTDHEGVAAWQLPLAARGADSRRTLESTDVAALYGWVISEGRFQRDVRAVNIYQNEGAHADEIRGILQRLSIPHSEFERTRTDYDGRPRKNVQWYIKAGPWAERILTDLAGIKPLPPEWLAWLPDDEALALFEALVSGDGSRSSGDESGAWYQKRPEVRAWFQTLCFRLGYRTSENTSKCMINWARSDTTEIQRGVHRKHWATKVQYKGDVWCPTVATGRWVARYRGNVFVTGNTGFPKSLNLLKAFEAKFGPAEAAKLREKLDGLGTALKPAVEHWILVQKPFEDTYAENFAEHGTGGLNIDGCRIGYASVGDRAQAIVAQPDFKQVNGISTYLDAHARNGLMFDPKTGRWPAHLSLDEFAAEILDEQSGELTSGDTPRGMRDGSQGAVYGASVGPRCNTPRKGDTGGASRFFYIAKGSRSEKDAGLAHLPPKTGGEATDREEGSAGTKNPRAGAGRTGGARNFHPTVKSVSLMRWLVRLITPAGGTVLDPFAGSGTTGVAAIAEGRNFIGVEQGGKDDEYIPILLGRIRHALGTKTP